MASSEKGGDPLKYYCIVFALLIAVVGFLYFKLKGERDEYRKESALAAKMLTGKGMPPQDSNGRPNKLGDLGIAVESMVEGYAKAVGAEGDTRGISGQKLDMAAKEVHMNLKRGGTERSDAYRSKGFMQVEKELVYADTTLDNLVKLLFNIEQTRYRVFEVRWKMKSTKENSQAPFFNIGAPTIKVGFRRALTSNER